jgi:hypothetical protein
MSSIAEDLSRTRFRFLNDVQIGALRRKYGLTRDEVRAAAIMADRIRRHRQAEEHGNSFRIELVSLHALIELQPKGKR